jgi:biotin transporter BioY
VELWIAFLLLAFLSGARATRRERKERVIWMLLVCVMAAGLFMFERYA